MLLTQLCDTSCGLLIAGEIFDMNAIHDPTTLDVEVLQDWHPVEGRVATRQKLVTINVGELWPGQNFRVPVRLIVPLDQRAKGFHLTGSSSPDRLQHDTKPTGIDKELLAGGVGLVVTVVQEPGTYGEKAMAQAAEERFAQTLNPHFKIQYGAWPATLMRAITLAFSEAQHFDEGKIAVTGASKNGASPSMAIVHDDRMTALHATVSPIWDSPLRLCDPVAWKELELQDGRRGIFSGGHFGPAFNQMVLNHGHTWEDLQTFTRDISDDVFISRNIQQLKHRGVEMLFHPGTHDCVAYDIAWGGKHHPTLPLYLGANTGHGKKGHPQLERDQSNKAAFLLQHFFPEDVHGMLLVPPTVEYQFVEDAIEVIMQFADDCEPEGGRIWWMFNRSPDGSPKYLSEPIPDENFAELHHDSRRDVWVAEIELPADAHHIDFFSNYLTTVRHHDRGYATYISSPYTRVVLPTNK